jgi:predicted dehydrogenase
VQQVLRAAEKKKRVLMVALNHRYRADVQIVRSFVQSGELGKVQSARGSWHVFRPSRSQLGWRTRRDEGPEAAPFSTWVTRFSIWACGSQIGPGRCG